MKEFKNLGEAIAHLRKLQPRLEKAVETSVRKGAGVLLKEVQEEVGEYQRTDTGPAPPMAELADATKEDRLKKGYTENDPGDRDKTMLRSYGVRADGGHAQVGSDDDHAVEFELGRAARTPGTNDDQPPRMVLTIAAHRKAPEVAAIVGEAVRRALTR